MKLLIDLPDYPQWPPELLRAEPVLLAELTDMYARRLDGHPAEVEDCLYSFVPGRVVGDALTCDPDQLPSAGVAWLMLVAGYFRGAWVRRERRHALLHQMNAQQGVPMDAHSFDGMIRDALQGLECARSGGSDASKHVEKTLPNIVGAFGYVQGALIEGSTNPPEGLSAPEHLLLPAGTLWSGFRHPRLPMLAELHGTSIELETSSDPEIAAMAEWIRELQSEAGQAGRENWRTIKSPAGMRPGAFAQLLDLAESDLEILLACALSAVRARLDGDDQMTRRAAAGCTLVTLLHGAYSLGVMDSNSDGARLPEFAA